MVSPSQPTSAHMTGAGAGCAGGTSDPPLPPYSGRQKQPWMVWTTRYGNSCAAAAGGTGLGSGAGSPGSPFDEAAPTTGFDRTSAMASCSRVVAAAKGTPKFCFDQASTAVSPAT